MNDWFNNNNLYLNPTKTSFMRFHHAQKPCRNLSLGIDGASLKPCNEVKFLGIFLDKNMTFKAHCKYLLSVLGTNIYVLNNLKQILNETQIVQVYYAHIESRLRYGIILWGWSTDSINVFLAQKRAIRCLAGVSQKTSCKPYFKHFNILTLYSLYVFEMCVYVFKNKTKFVYNSNIHCNNTRAKDDFRVPFVKYNSSYKLPNISGVRFFNYLPVEIKKCANFVLFKKRLKEFLVSKCLYSVDEYFTCT